MKVLKYETILSNLVKKYNKGVWDEDLMQEAWLTAISCEQANPDLEEEKLQAKVIVWVKNRLINIQTKAKFDFSEFTENIEDESDYFKLLVEVKASLTDKENEILDLLLDGKTAKDIQKELNISKSTVYRFFEKIKGIIRE